MKSRFSISIVAIFLSTMLIAPITHAQSIGVPTGDWVTELEGTISAVANPLTAAATTLQQINSYVIQPLAMVLSGNLLKSITSSVVGFVNGKSNGTGKSQFTTNLQGTLQTTGDVQALAFFAALKSSNSPFAASVTSSLTNNYLQNTSMAGFFAANQCTLSQSSPNINSFLAGNWSQGGVGAWFALTTQSQNNPYTFYQTSQGELASVVGGAQSAQITQLGWGQGMASWCGPTTSNSSAASCTNKNGSPGTVQTPGSTINASLNKALGTDQSKLVAMGSAGSDINSILSSVGTALQTMALVSSIVNGSSGGLSGVANSSATSRNASAFAQYQSAGYMGVTPTSVVQNAPTLSITVSAMSNNISQYQSAWNTINTAAIAASTSVANLASYCTSQAAAAQNLLNGTDSENPNAPGVLDPFISAANAQAAAVPTVITNEIAPVFAQVANAATVVANANAMIQKIQNEQSSTASTANTAYVADMQTLQTMSPTATDVATAGQNAKASGTAGASPTGSLNVSGGSLVDRMNLINTNANTVCNIPSVPRTY
jgi:hypothetical protein